ncbi:hypothetical protein [Mycobacterium sp.]|uniref:hypothetical protein n=1 Tax=Mycobacterium sp. TaxID=1785 RepID=UPI003C5F0010
MNIHQQLTTRLAKSPAAQQAEIRVLPGVVQFANTHIKSCAHQYPKVMKHFSDGRRAAAPGAEHDNDRLSDRHLPSRRSELPGTVPDLHSARWARHDWCATHRIGSSTAKTRRCWLRRPVCYEMTRGDDNFVCVGDGPVINVKATNGGRLNVKHNPIN